MRRILKVTENCQSEFHVLDQEGRGPAEISDIHLPNYSVYGAEERLIQGFCGET